MDEKSDLEQSYMVEKLSKSMQAQNWPYITAYSIQALHLKTILNHMLALVIFGTKGQSSEVKSFYQPIVI